MTLVDVLLPLPLEGKFTYSLPQSLAEEVRIGSRVVVPLGTKRHYTGIVTRIHSELPSSSFQLKEVKEVSDPEPIILPTQIALWQWIADYYLCTEGEVLKAALPSGFKIESDTLRTTYRPLTEQRIRLSAPYQGAEHEGALNEACNSLKRAPKQQQLLLRYLEYANYADGECRNEVTRHALLEQSGLKADILHGLLSKGILEAYDVELSRLAEGSDALCHIATALSPAQERCRTEIHAAWQTHDVCLLHGVTSSGKTEIYIHLIEEAIQQGRQVLYLMPEIALTTQMENRLRRVFGSRLGVYHSRFSDAERVEIWKKQLSDEPYDVILGVRSSVFLPFSRLGLVIVDEEHENTYKQQDPAPRYHARNVALVLAAQQGAKTLLGTATPSFESYFNACTGKYGLVTLNERWGAVQMPEIEIVDIRELYRKRRMSGSFSPRLLGAIREALARGEQAILFQNRRGYAPMLECPACGWVPRCERCDVSLTYHRRLGQLVCHYCGNAYRVPLACPACGEQRLRYVGLGTERIEEELHSLIPEARIDRMDLDTTHARNAYERILNDFAERRTDILIGTQMVSKGLDFAHVSVVGIMNADTMLNYPDFRSHERAYQLMAQVAGRCGRRDKQGLVILQTKSSDLPIVSHVRRYDYDTLYAEQMAERQAFGYPPYTRLIFLYLRGRDERRLTEGATLLRSRLDGLFGAARVLGPEAPAVARINGLSIRKIMLKFEPSCTPRRVRTQLRSLLSSLTAEGALSGLSVHFDADPM